MATSKIDILVYADWLHVDGPKLILNATHRLNI